MTAAKLLADLRRSGVVLTANADRLAFDAPAGAMTPTVMAIVKARKPELLAVLRGDYLGAALALVLSVDDPEQRAELAYLFDERAGICQNDGGMSRGEGERLAYVELARRVDWTAQSVAVPSETSHRTPQDPRSGAETAWEASKGARRASRAEKAVGGVQPVEPAVSPADQAKGDEPRAAGPSPMPPMPPARIESAIC